MDAQKLKKLENISQRIISNYVVEFSEFEERFWIITIINIKISSDLSYLDVFVSSFKNSSKLTKALAKHAHFMTKKINSEISLRKIPKIRFRYDESWKIWESVCETIKKYNK